MAAAAHLLQFPPEKSMCCTVPQQTRRAWSGQAVRSIRKIEQSRYSRQIASVVNCHPPTMFHEPHDDRASIASTTKFELIDGIVSFPGCIKLSDFHFAR